MRQPTVRDEAWLDGTGTVSEIQPQQGLNPVPVPVLSSTSQLAAEIRLSDHKANHY